MAFMLPAQKKRPPMRAKREITPRVPREVTPFITFSIETWISH